MLIRVQRDLSFVSRGPVGLPAIRVADDDSTFNGTYMRPNSNNNGSIPASAPYSDCPDIWIAGTTAVANYQTALATNSSYATSSSKNIYVGQTNLIYVRGKNGATTSKTNTVTLYYAPSAVIINDPSTWKNNVIKTEIGQTSGNITNLAPGAVGVCDATFAWTDVQSPPSGSSHYCLFAQFNDAQNSNPFPSVDTALDMGSLIMNNLGWGWRNTAEISAKPSWSDTVPLTIPSNFPAANYYSIFVIPTGYVGWKAKFYASENDSNGNPIALKKSKVDQDGQILGVQNAYLEPGFECLMTVNMYGSGSPPVGAMLTLSCNCVVSTQQDLREAVERNLIDWDFMYRLKRSCPELFGVTPTAFITLGYYNWKVTNNPAIE